jgi:hypothetical protein
VKAGFDIEVVKRLEPGKPRDPDKHSCFVFPIGDKHSAKGIRPRRGHPSAPGVRGALLELGRPTNGLASKSTATV